MDVGVQPQGAQREMTVGSGPPGVREEWTRVRRLGGRVLWGRWLLSLIIGETILGGSAWVFYAGSRDYGDPGSFLMKAWSLLMTFYCVFIFLFGVKRLWTAFQRRRVYYVVRAPAQDVGFTSLELDAFEAVKRTYPQLAPQIQEQLRTATIVARQNTGSGCLTQFRTDTAPLPANFAPGPLFFNISGLEHPVTVTIWQTGGLIDALEIFTTGQSSIFIDWASAVGDAAETGIETRRPRSHPRETSPLWRG